MPKLARVLVSGVPSLASCILSVLLLLSSSFLHVIPAKCTPGVCTSLFLTCSLSGGVGWTTQNKSPGLLEVSLLRLPLPFLSTFSFLLFFLLLFLIPHLFVHIHSRFVQDLFSLFFALLLSFFPPPFLVILF